MHVVSEKLRNDVDVDAVIAELAEQYRNVAEATDIANAEYLSLRATSGRHPALLEAAKRRWLLLEQQRRAIEARLDLLDQ